MLLTVTNQRTSSIAFQTDGLAFVSFTVPGSGAVTDKSITPSQFAALEPQLNAAKTAGHITWLVKDDPASVADNGGVGASPQALSGAGAASLNTEVTLVTSTGAGQVITVANGTYIGQRKTFVHVVDGGSAVVTPATANGFATATLTNARDTAQLYWTGAAWVCIGFSGGTVLA